MLINRQKTSYQKNMIIGTMISSLLILIPSVWIYFSRIEAVIIDSERVEIGYQKFLLNKSSAGNKVTHEYGSQTGNINLTIKHIFSDRIFKDFEAVKSINLSCSIVMSKDHYPILNKNDLEILYGDENGRLTIIPGAVEDRQDFPIPATYAVGPYDRTLKSFFSGRQISIRKCEPDRDMCIVFPDKVSMLPPVYYKEEPVVILQITIDEKGNILDLKTIYENPPKRGFARRIREILIQDAFIEPAIKDGKEQGGTYYFSWRHMNNGNGRTQVKSSSDVTVLLKRGE